MTSPPSNFGLLVADVGGTNTRLALYDSAGRKRLGEVVRPSREHASFDEIALGFLAQQSGPHPVVAVIGVAGNVVGGSVRFTNLSWVLEEKALARKLAIPRVVLLNDLVAAANGCLVAPPGILDTITQTPPKLRGLNAAVISAGTGLGEARLIWDGERHLALATEGGHADFAPQTPLEIEFWHFLSARFSEHVSNERVLSGDGLGHLFDFFSSRAARPSRAIAKRLATGDRNVAIAELGVARTYRPATKAVDMLAAIYGAEAGNLALRELALGGVFVAGHIAEAVLPSRREIFLERFCKKGRFHPLLERIPVAIVTDSHIGVRGSLAVAKRLAGEAGPKAPRRARG